MTVEVEIEGQEFTTLNGGPHFKFSEAISFQVPCESRGWVPLFRRRTQGHDPLTLTELCLDTRNMSTMQPINRRRPTAIGSRVPDSVRRHWLASDRNGADRQTPAKLIEGVPAAAPSV